MYSRINSTKSPTLQTKVTLVNLIKKIRESAKVLWRISVYLCSQSGRGASISLLT